LAAKEDFAAGAHTPVTKHHDIKVCAASWNVESLCNKPTHLMACYASYCTVSFNWYVWNNPETLVGVKCTVLCLNVSLHFAGLIPSATSDM
jgi:hypothetical protein